MNHLPVPILVAAGFCFVALAIGMIARLRWAIYAIMGMIFVATTSVSVGPGGVVRRLWLDPVQENRSFIFAVLGSMLYIGIIGHLWARAERAFPWQGFALLLMAMYGGALTFIHSTPGDGASSIVFAMVTIAPMLFIVPMLLQQRADYFSVIRALGIVDLVWLGATAVQFFVNPKLLTKGNLTRFEGLTANPQHAAVYLGVMTVVLAWLFMNDPKRSLRFIWLLAVGINAVMLIWTGSRTGVAMFIIGAVIAFYGRLGRTILVLPLLFIVVVGGLYVAEILHIDMLAAEHLTSTDDTRSAVWISLFEKAMDNPWFGVGVGLAGDSENSYLFGFAAFGIGWALLLLLLIAVTAGVCLKLMRWRRWVDPERRALIDLTIAYNAMYFAGAMLEGYLMARVASNLVLILLFSGIASQLLREFSTEAATGFEFDPVDDDETEHELVYDEEEARGYDVEFGGA